MNKIYKINNLLGEAINILYYQIFFSFTFENSLKIVVHLRVECLRLDLLILQKLLLKILIKLTGSDLRF